MPACGPDWVLVTGTRMTADALTIALREILIKEGITREEACTYTSHSMKTTFLSMIGKAGIRKGIRRTLGGHSKPGDKMPDLYSRDELAEPLRQLGHVLVWGAARAFLPDCSRSGRWVKHPREARRDLAQSASAAEVLDTMIGPQESPQWTHARELATRGHEILEDTPALEGATSDVELPESDVDEADDEDDERDALQERAAEVEVDTRAAEKQTEGEAKLCYAPLHLKVLRHLFRGRRHWSEDGQYVICPWGSHPNYMISNYREAVTHEDPFCDGCLRAATKDFGVVAPERYVHGLASS